MSADLECPCLWAKECGKYPQEGCLAGTVWPEDREALASAQIKVDAVQRSAPRE